MTTTPDLGIPELAQAQATPEITHNEALVLIQALLNGVIDKDLTSPPGSPTEGDAYIVGGSATGAWAGWDDHIAIYWGGSWRVVPGYDDGGSLITIGARQEGLSVYVRDEDLRYTWTQSGSPATFQWVAGGGGGSAASITYDNSSSGLSATDVQAAVDEVEGRVDTAESDVTAIEAKTDILWENGSGVASATSVDLSGLDGDEIHVTGTATITEITGLVVGQEATLVADGAWTLEHDGTDVTIPGSDDFIAAAGDRVRIRCTSTDDVEVLWATRINGRAPFDYEEGTFTPTVAFAIVGDFSPTYTIQYGSYVKAGRMCNISHTVSMQTNAFTTAAGAVRYAGLPFNASIDGSEALWPCSAPFFSNYTYGASQVDLCGFVNEGTDYMLLFANRSAAGVQQWVATTNVTPSTSGMASRLSASYPT